MIDLIAKMTERADCFSGNILENVTVVTFVDRFAVLSNTTKTPALSGKNEGGK